MLYLFLAVIVFIFIFSIFGKEAGFINLGLFIAGFILWRFELLDNIFNIIIGFFSGVERVLQSIYSYIDQILT